ncbi:phage distal tail protein [Nocardiopsis synnemataformans]|uniref:phage distal tail protein n=1 Tax=Nocardiopsis synnemataformans TaxID=61305 RepID=UPI003EC12F6D
MNEELQLPVFHLGRWAGNRRDEHGVEWWIVSDEGWTGSPPPRVDLTDRPQRHGAFDAPSYRTPRVITLEGVAIAPSRATKERAKDTFAALLADGSRLFPLVVREHTATRQVRVRLTDGSRTRDTTPYAFEWSLQVTAPDPTRYSHQERRATTAPPTRPPGLAFPLAFPLGFGEEQGGRFTARNAGTIPTAPRWEITGPCVDPVVQHAVTGEHLAFDITLRSGQRLDVDVDARTVLLGTSTSPGSVSRRSALRSGSRWFDLAPGTNQITFRTADGDPGARLSGVWRDAWL